MTERHSHITGTQIDYHSFVSIVFIYWLIDWLVFNANISSISAIYYIGTFFFIYHNEIISPRFIILYHNTSGWRAEYSYIRLKTKGMKSHNTQRILTL
jgi:hypothetical protein